MANQELDINAVLQHYQNKLASANHENILMQARIEQLEIEIEQNSKDA
ncbi:hypothetical protein [Geomicrobium sp. JCM 19055]|nr:hypothetical protein [Geomicrobium sp. JCM 19055]